MQIEQRDGGKAADRAVTATRHAFFNRLVMQGREVDSFLAHE